MDSEVNLFAIAEELAVKTKELEALKETLFTARKRQQELDASCKLLQKTLFACTRGFDRFFETSVGIFHAGNGVTRLITIETQPKPEAQTDAQPVA